MDQNSDLFNNENEISRADIYNELTYYLNLSFPETHEYKFEKVNNYILEPTLKGTVCGGNAPQSKPNSDNRHVEVWPQKYFPNIWFDKVLEMVSGDSKTIRMRLPNNYQKWKIYGISVHPTKGFTVAKRKPEIGVKSDFDVHINSPKVVQESENPQVDENTNHVKEEKKKNCGFLKLKCIFG